MPRRWLGLTWLIGLVVIPLLIAAIGYGAYDRPRSGSGPTGAVPVLTPSNKSGAPTLSLAPLSISRDGNDITLTGDFPDDSAKSALLKALKGGLGSGVNVIDQIQINPDVDALDFSNAGAIFKDSASITDFNLTVDGDTVTLAGTAASAGQKNTIEKAAAHTWSNLNVVDHLVVNGSGPSPAPPGPPTPRQPTSGHQSTTPRWSRRVSPRRNRCQLRRIQHGFRDPVVVVPACFRGGLGGCLGGRRRVEGCVALA